MEFLYGGRELANMPAIHRQTFLLTNGLGGYCSLSAVFSAPRSDQGVLVAAVTAPNRRINLVHRLSERLTCADGGSFLSSQCFADGETEEDGYRRLVNFTFEDFPVWEYEVSGVQVTRRCCMRPEENTAAVMYRIRNTTAAPCTLTVAPGFKFAPKEEPVTREKTILREGNRFSADGYHVYIHTDGTLRDIPQVWQALAYPEDAVDGRPEKGLAGICCRIEKTVQPGETARLELIFSTEETVVSAGEVLRQAAARMQALEDACPFADPAARQLAVSADAYIARRDSTGGKTILAGYPLFSDWGRDTMIALPGCVLATGRMEDAVSILRTFLAYEQDGLVPNLFPEGDQEPMYNTVDAALLLIDCVWQYVQKSGDWVFVREAWETLERIIACYRKGTHHAIGMDADGLIFAGQGLDQVTWMDVCVQGILPTPRHGKPVEINAYWYNALRIMGSMAKTLGCDGRDYEALAETVRRSFIDKFYMPEEGCLRDVISGTDADRQIRCNQIWALAMPFTMLEPEQERRVLDTVYRHLYTPFGLRTLSPEDPQYHPHYGGPQLERDMAYHQGTTWVFPLGAYYRAYLRVNGGTPEAVRTVREQMENLGSMLRQGCAGQLPEIYDGHRPGEGKGCFAQAWSVGEILRVYEEIDRTERRHGGFDTE